jgi:hypothetical protein
MLPEQTKMNNESCGHHWHHHEKKAAGLKIPTAL